MTRSMLAAGLLTAGILAGWMTSAGAQAPALSGDPGHQAEVTATSPPAPHPKRQLTNAQRRTECLQRYRQGHPRFNRGRLKWPAYYARCNARLLREGGV